MRSLTVVASIVAVGLMLFTGTPNASAAKLWVGTSSTNCPKAEYSSIQQAIAEARPKDKIIVCAGTYDEQIVIGKRLKIIGKEGAIVQPSNMVANTTSIRTREAIAGAVVCTANKVLLRNLEIDVSQNGVGCGSGHPQLVGVFFRGVSGSLKKSTVHGTKLAEAERSCDSGAAVFVQGSGSRINVTISGNTVSDYQRAGIVVNETGARATIRSNVVTGLGDTPGVAQNGIQVGYGGFAKILKNVVQNNRTPTTGSCTFDGGNLIFEANGGLISRNSFTGNTSGVFVSGSKNRITRNQLNGKLSDGVAAGLDGISVLGDRNVVLRNVINDMSAAGVRVSGEANRVTKNTVRSTLGANLCDSVSTTSGCGDVLDLCGVGIRVMSGSTNTKVIKNTLLGNDTDMRNDGTGTTDRGN